MNEVNPEAPAAAPTPAPTNGEAPVDPSRIWQEKEVGPISYGPGGPYSGCILKSFASRFEGGYCVQGASAVDQCNQFFTDLRNVQVVQMWVSEDHEKVTVLYTRTLDDAEMEVVKQRGHIIELQLKEFRQERAARQKQMDEEVEAEHKRLVEKAAIGEHCEKNHGAVVKQLRAKSKGKKGGDA